VLGLGYLASGIVVALVITATAIGDHLSQPPSDGGLGLGATATSLIFFAALIGVVGYLSMTNGEVIHDGSDGPAATDRRRRRDTGRYGLL
jgi:uncharacterized membrane-anchored protein